jgi:site-specific DNA-cytosine methylase
VKGFINSEMYHLWKQTMQHLQYTFHEFMLSPDELLGIPNKRNRYYFVAKYCDNSHGGSLTTRAGGIPSSLSTSNGIEDETASEAGSRFVSDKFIVLQDGKSKIYTDLPKSIKAIYHQCYSDLGDNQVLTIGEMLQPLYQATGGSKGDDMGTNGRSKYDKFSPLRVPAAILSSSWAKQGYISLLSPEDRLSYCFTKGYGKLFDHSAGSCFLIPSIDNSIGTTNPIETSDGPVVSSEQYFGRVRLFHPDELLVIFGFPRSYSFPASEEMKELQHQFGCIGNSINVMVVKAIMHFLFFGI